jgi:hypothetical protein
MGWGTEGILGGGGWGERGEEGKEEEGRVGGEELLRG